MPEMTEEEKNQAAAYIKLQDDVKELILGTVVRELQTNPYGVLSMLIQSISANNAKTIIDREVQNYRIVYRGNTASY